MVAEPGIIWRPSWDSASSAWASPNGPSSCRVSGLPHGGSELPKLQIWELPELRYHSTLLLLPSIH